MRLAMVAATLLIAMPASAQTSVRALVDLARQQAGSGQASRAVETLRGARALAPNSEEVLSAYARAALSARAPGEAIGPLEALARLCPTDADYPYLLGVARLQTGNLGGAVDALRAAAALDPNRAVTFVALGLALNNQKLYADAKASLLRALELQPESVETVAALAEAHEGLDELDAAESLAHQVSGSEASAGATATARLVTGMVLTKRGRYAEARDALLDAVGVETTMQKAHYQLSLVYARLGDEEASRKHLDLYRRARQDAEDRLKGTKRP